ncbi:MAG: neutral/alkaline non-lysosomal ceramidase N-terminal domain-containing protein [Myxococcales bacterium]|nr:neutral/alkaline non-lysosomal ceramidase N-terminal domain-containing protein [Myxococcales bacterium]MCB9521386.1 neutral/alkaline non-lysosomal ceramidase N-terminal domain-containing protein [Myxococcales bacterium]MCB9533797.1 neutral/alkaline non-lysosomal ceramidase N-terminal domain-containing protein [Myxococcales bacterium]
MARNTLRVGAARVDITTFEPGMPLLGWGMQYNTGEGVHAPLHARAVVVRDPSSGRRVALVCCELLLISDRLREGVLERLQVAHPDLGIGRHELHLTATHTHSGPAGFADHMVYNLPNPGYSARVTRHLIEGITRAIADACASECDATLRVASVDVPVDEPVAFNRSIDAFNRNHDVRPAVWERRREATDRTLTIARFDAVGGAPIAAYCWFPLHGTSVHSDNHLLHPDNKGIAATLLEAAIATEHGVDFVAAFAQGAAGDVTPNFRWNEKRRRMIGVSDDDIESARVAGEIQARYARHAWDAAGQAAESPPAVDAHTLHLDFRGFEAAPQHAGGAPGRRTGPGWLGLTFLEGTREGSGPLLHAPVVARTARRASALAARIRQRRRGSEGRDENAWDEVQAPKYPFLQSGLGTSGGAFGFFDPGRPRIPGAVDFVVAAVKRFDAVDAVGAREWTPNTVVVQLVVLGELVVAALPCEPCTVAGRRLTSSIGAALGSDGARRVVIAGYSNGYSGYLTTPEEYDLQRYEGASTLFGRWTLAVYQTRFDAVAEALSKPIAAREPSCGPEIRLASAVDIFAQGWPGREWVASRTRRDPTASAG